MIRRRSSVRNRLELWAYRTARATAGRLAAGSLARLGAALGELYLLTDRRRREILWFNLALAFADLSREGRRQLAREAARHLGRITLDTLRLPRLSGEQLLAEVTIDGRQHLDRALAADRGCFLLSAHLGCWEAAALVAGLCAGTVGKGFSIVTRPLDNPLLEAELVRLRSRYGNRPLGKAGVVKEVLRRLEQGDAVGILIDQRCSEREGIQVPLFGQPSWTHPILARLVLRSAAPVVPIWGLWHGPARSMVRFEEPVLLDRLPAGERTETALTARFNRITEAAIRRYPEQWLWYHDRWRQIRLAAAGR